MSHGGGGGGFGGHGGHGGHMGHHGGHHAGHHHAGGHPDQLPNWNMAMQGDTFWSRLLKIDRRPFMVLFLMFFGAFMWLYILYQLSHREGQRDSASATQRRESVQQSAAPAISVSPQPAYSPAASAAGEGETAGSAAGEAPTTPGAFNQAVRNAADQSAQGQYSAFAAAAANPFGVSGGASGSSYQAPGASPYAAPGASPYPAPGGQSLSGAVPGMQGFDRNAAISAPRTFRHALGGYGLYEPMANGRQKMIVTR